MHGCETNAGAAGPGPPGTKRGGHPLMMVAVLMASDLAALSACGIAAVWGYLAVRGAYHPLLYVRLWPCLLIFPLCYEFAGLYHGVALYPGVGLSPAEELRRLTVATTAGYLLLGVATFLSKRGPIYSRAVFLIAWTLSLLVLPACRSALRRFLFRRPWWGIRCVIFGAGDTAGRVIEVLTRRPEFGLRPVAVFAGNTEDAGAAEALLPGVPVLSSYDAAAAFATREGVSYAIVAEPGLAPERLLEIIEGPARGFRHILVIPQLFGTSCIWATARDVGTIFGLEIRQNLLLPFPRRLKRGLDLLLILAAAPLALPLSAFLALLGKLTSPGPVFFRQERVGRAGRPFAMWKFRTMRVHGEDVLAEYFARNPEARREWERHRKLRHDPRVTRVGRFLRSFSLDELPQLYNVLRGEMSIVGPRPIVAAEIPGYGDAYALYIRVSPGLTGLWQVSGRNRLSFAERVELDAFYVRNWSLWLDLYILTRTLPAVLRRDGAF